MSFPVCVTCGVQYAEKPEGDCPICADSRQYVAYGGQQWTTLKDLLGKHHNVFTDIEPRVVSIHSEPAFAIGQRAFLIDTGEGNLLWDCITLLDDATIAGIERRGSITAMAISHPHYYSTMIEWSNAFGGIPIWIHEAERDWICRPAPQVQFWSGYTHKLPGGITLIRSGGHFDGYQVAHWPDGAEGRGALFAGDQPQVCGDRRWVSFLYSYPNMIPFNARQVQAITASLEPFAYERLYGAFGRHVLQDAKGAVARSAERYLRAIS
ncbi:MAG: MBL fold metallo-hydrolase [Bryobacterales bacterium]|nr:MBL fold metallo-hydrolase [Bryobacterales bacterium]